MARNLKPPPDAADYLGVALQTLSNWRYEGRGPRYIKVGRLIKYDQADLDAWLDEHASDREPAA